MKNIRAAVVLFLVAVFLAGVAYATTSSINPNVPAQNSPLSSSVLRGNFGDAYNDINTLFGIDTLSSNQLLGTVNAGMAGPLNLPSCPLGGLSWTPGTGFGCTNIAGIVSPVTNALVFTGAFAVNYNAVTLPTKQTGTVIQFGDADTVTSRLEADCFAAPCHFTGVRADGTNAAPTTLQSGDEIASFNAFGYNGSATVGPKAAFRTYASQNWTGGADGTYADIATTLAGTTTMAEVIKFENDGGIDTPGVTGGDCGAGCINAGGVKVNNVPVLTANQTVTLSGDASGSGATTITVTNAKVNGVAYGSSPSTNTVPVVTGSNAVTYEAVPVAAGGTGDSTLTQYGVLLGNGTSGVSALAPSTTSGWVLTSNGTSANPSWQASSGGGSGDPMIKPDSAYTADTAGNLFPYLYTGSGSNAAPSDWNWGVVASLASNVVLQMRFPMPTHIPGGTFKLFSWCKANATTGNALYTPSDAFVAAGSSESAATLTGDTQVMVSPTTADVPILSKTTLSATPSADGYEIVAVTFNSTSWTLAQILACRFAVGWE